MPAHICLVSFTDPHRVRHTVEVSASSLYEAVVLGLVEFKKCQFTHVGIPVGAALSVRVKEPEQTHEVKITAVKAWLERQGGSPREVAQRQNLRQMLEAVRE